MKLLPSQFLSQSGDVPAATPATPTRVGNTVMPSPEDVIPAPRQRQGWNPEPA
jgi:hypothetical protein